MPAARALLRAPSAVVRAMWRIASAAALVLFIAVGVFAALLLVVRLVVFPHIERYRDAITAAISREVHEPVEIDVLSTGWDGWNPKLVIEGFRIGPPPAPGAAATLELPRVDLTISWTSLPLLELTLDQLVFDKPRLSIRRDTQGVIHLAGIEIDPAQAKDDSRVSDWLLRQRQIVVRDALITWTDESRAAPQLVLDDVDFRLERRFGRRYFGLRGNPPPEIAAPIDIRGELGRGSLHGFAQAEGRLYVRLDYADVSAWKEWLPLPRDLASGKGALRTWFTFAQGEAREIVADLELADVRMRVAPELPELVLPRLSGRAGWRVAGAHHDLYTRQLGFATASGAAFEPANLALAADMNDDRTTRSGRLVFDRLQLKPLRELAAGLPLPGALRDALRVYAPTGTLTGGDVQWTGTIEAPQKFDLGTEFRDVAFMPNGAVPGASGLGGTLKASERGGEIKLAAHDATLAIPQHFPQPVGLAVAQGDLAWTHVTHGTDVRIGRLEFGNADLAGHLSGTYHYAGPGPATVDLEGQLTRASLPALPRYLPTHLSQRVRDWVARAIRGTTLDDVRVKLKGNLSAFPFTDAKAGTFSVDLAGKGLALDYAEGWPQLTDIDAGVHFRNAGVTIEGSRARVYGIQLANITATIPDLRNPVLSVNGIAQGATRDFFRFIQSSPVNRWTGEVAKGAEAQGDGRLDLKLTLPLQDLPSTRVAGEYAFSANQLKLANVPALGQLNGRVAFTERDVRGQDITAQAVGGPVRFALASGDGHMRVTGSGTSPIAALAREWPVPLFDRASGTAEWTLALDIGDDAITWTVDSPLKGVALDLPPPLRKSAADVLAAHIERRPLPRGGGDTIQVALGSTAQMAIRRVPVNGELRLERVLVSLGGASTLPDARRAERPGLWVRADVPAIDVDQWLKLQRTLDASPRGSGRGGDEFALSGLDLKAGTLTAFGRDFTNAKATGRRVQGDWKIELSAAEVEGSATWVPPTTGAPNGRVVARFARFSVPPATSNPDAVADPASAEASAAWPELDVTADALRTAAKRELGRLQVLAKPGRGEWRIERLVVENDSGRMDAHGAWRTGVKPEETRLDIALDVKDAGSFLARLGHPGAVQGAATKINGQLAWAGAPSDFDYPTLSGSFKLETANGRFMKIEPGIGKLLGVLSLQALPRRISLDFRDIFSEGFAFDRVTSNVRIANGVMNTDDFHLSGPSAQVNIAGSVDLASETQRLQVKVQPTLSAGVSAGAALVFLANPLVGAAVGAGSLLAQKVLKDPIEQMFSYQYAVTGSWSDPVVARGPMATASAAPEPVAKP